jgi:hypothetical protein
MMEETISNSVKWERRQACLLAILWPLHHLDHGKREVYMMEEESCNQMI